MADSAQAMFTWKEVSSGCPHAETSFCSVAGEIIKHHILQAQASQLGKIAVLFHSLSHREGGRKNLTWKLLLKYIILHKSHLANASTHKTKRKRLKVHVTGHYGGLICIITLNINHKKERT